MRRVFVLGILLLLLGIESPKIRAQGASPAGPPPTLAQALNNLPPEALSRTVLMTLAPEHEYGPRLMPGQSASPDPSLVGLESIAALYHRLIQGFGPVTALAPATMFVLNTGDLSKPPIALLAQQNPLQYLLGSLTKAQLQQLGGQGLGMEDLTPDQRTLFAAVLPKPLSYVPSSATLPTMEGDPQTWTRAQLQDYIDKSKVAQAAYDAQVKTVADDALSGVRLRANLQADYVFNVPGQDGYGVGVDPARGQKPSAGGYKLSEEVVPVPSNDTMNSVLRSEEPNLLKPGALHWDQSVLNISIPLDNLKTVDDLVGRISKATHLELYADPRYGRRTLFLKGDVGKPVRARFLLQALALCATGTWRQVGPAYVLTDDLLGVAARRAYLKEAVNGWSNTLRAGAKETGDHLSQLNWTQIVHFADDDPNALPSSLAAQVDRDSQKATGFGASIPYGQLPAGIQSGLHGGLDDYTAHSDLQSSSQKIEKDLTPKTSVYVTFNLRFFVVVPSAGAVALSNEYRIQKSDPPSSPHSDAPPPPKPAVFTAALRGIMGAPRTPDEARQLVDKMAILGYNALFCKAFTGGQTDFPNPVLPPDSSVDAQILPAAIAEGKRRNITVYGVVDTLCWGLDGTKSKLKPLPGNLPDDLGVLGETPAQTIRRQSDSHSLAPYEDADTLMSSAGAQRWVSPADPKVAQMLVGITRALVQLPGLAGAVFQETGAPGYIAGDNNGQSGPNLGYSFPQRLAYLRLAHADPIDIGDQDQDYVTIDGGGSYSMLNFSLPNFDAGGDANGQDVVKEQWNTYRVDADKALLTALYAAAHNANPGMPLFMRERLLGVTLQPWTSAKIFNQYTSLASEGGQVTKAARPDTLVVVPIGYMRRSLGSLPDAIQGEQQQFGNNIAGGLILDFTWDHPGTSSLQDLTAISPYIHAGIVEAGDQPKR